MNWLTTLLNRIWRDDQQAVAANVASLADARAAAVRQDLFRLTGRVAPTASVLDAGTIAPGIQPKPAVRQEQFAEVKQTENRLEVQRRVVRSANRHVTRDYGHGPVDETFARHKTVEPKAYAADVDYEYLGLTVGEPGGRPAMVPVSQEEMERRARLSQATKTFVLGDGSP